MAIMPIMPGISRYIQPSTSTMVTKKPRRFRLMNLDEAMKVKGWKVCDKGLVHEQWIGADKFSYNMPLAFWVGNEPHGQFVDIMEAAEGHNKDSFKIAVIFSTCGHIIPLSLLHERHTGSCVCDIKWLFSYGCKCGGFAREMAGRCATNANG